MLVTAAILLLVLLLMIGESLVINSCIKSIAVKIHINGTRGKSTITRYIHAGIKEDQQRVLAKVTGEIPTYILPDGNNKTLKRRGSARVQEQFNVLRKAKKEKVDALVLECMSIDPILQKLESSFYKSDIYVVCNIRDDHREKMGDTFEEQVKSICSAIPKNSKIIAAESDYSETIHAYAILQNSEFIRAIELSEDEKNVIPRNAHQINIQLALTACLESGVARDIAFRGILNQTKNAASPLLKIDQAAHQKYFLDAFKVNDISSVEDYLQHWTDELGIKNKLTVVFNTRSDRPLRTGLFTEWIKNYQKNIETVILSGDHKMMANRLLKKSDQPINIVNLKSKSAIKKQILENAGDSRLIVGIGNMKGLGHQIINEFSEAS